MIADARSHVEGEFKDVGGDVLTCAGWQHWGLTGFLSYDRLLNDAEDSPITQSGLGQFFIGALLSYRFDAGS